MARTNPLGRIKNVAIDSIKDPRRTAETVAGQARGTVALGRIVVGQVGTKLAGLRHHGADGKPTSNGVAPAPRRSPEEAPTVPQAKAPAAPKAKAPAAPTPAEPDTTEPEVTPADIARNIAPKPAAKRTTRPPAKKAPAKKAAPGAKLPPRKKTPTE